MDAQDSLALLEEINTHLENIELWLKFENRERLKSTVDEELNDKDKILYNLLDGTSSYTELQEKSSYGSRATISRRLKEWSKLGIIKKNQEGKWEHLASLNVLGLDEPEVGDDS